MPGKALEGSDLPLQDTPRGEIPEELVEFLVGLRLGDEYEGAVAKRKSARKNLLLCVEL
jgi:hypothetical protein